MELKAVRQNNSYVVTGVPSAETGFFVADADMTGGAAMISVIGLAGVSYRQARRIQSRDPEVRAGVKAELLNGPDQTGRVTFVNGVTGVAGSFGVESVIEVVPYTEGGAQTPMPETATA